MNLFIKRNQMYKYFLHLILIIFCILCILPMVLVISISISDETDIINSGYSIIPKTFTFNAYKYLFKNPEQIIRSYIVTITVVIVGTLLSMFNTTTLSYVTTRKDYPLANKTAFYVFFTMLFNGGMVSWYILVSRWLNLSDTIFALILPYGVISWFVMMMRGFFKELPFSIIESAKIDGASEYTIFFKLVLPLSKPSIATVSLFYALMFWNDYWLSLMFINRSKNVSLQLLLYRIMSSINFLNSELAIKSGVKVYAELPNLSARMAICVIAAGPMMFVFPFFQKYFVKGITIGAVKG